ncbi:MAG: ribbon-helix-helix protein, CopG family [Wenzhouxiangella sp.]|nr:MAG: ribbon-helix-helix protein, CopG family [Wenzhouxiangella sp.]
MARMTVRTSYALDKETAANIKRMARSWGVSQAEVIRRSIRRIAEQEGPAAMTPAEVVAHYASGPPVRTEESLRAITRTLRKERHAEDQRRSVGGE